MFPIKEFNQRLSFERENTERNALNELTGGWSEAFKAWARVRPVSQRDHMGADQPHAVAAYIFTIRRCMDADLAALSAMRLRWDGGVYYVSGEPLKLDNGRYLQIRATSQKVTDV